MEKFIFKFNLKWTNININIEVQECITITIGIKEIKKK